MLKRDIEIDTALALVWKNYAFHVQVTIQIDQDGSLACLQWYLTWTYILAAKLIHTSRIICIIGAFYHKCIMFLFSDSSQLCMSPTLATTAQSPVWTAPSNIVIWVPMGKGVVGKRTVLAYAKQKTPASLQESGPEKSFREVKRKSIIAGLRVLKAPAATRHDWWVQLGLHIDIYIFTFTYIFIYIQKYISILPIIISYILWSVPFQLITPIDESQNVKLKENCPFNRGLIIPT